MIRTGRVLRTGLLWLRHRTRLRGSGPPGFHPSRKTEPDYVEDARRNPQNYFTCAGCGSRPWHKSWARIELGRSFTAQKMQYAMPTKPLGGCCSGAD